MKTKRRNTSALSTAAVLLCLVLATSHFTFGMYARYATRASGADTGRAAAFKVSAAAETNDPVSIEAMGSGTYKVTVRNDGEVPVRYEARVTSSHQDAVSVFEDIDLTGSLDPKESKVLTVQLDMKEYKGADTEIPFDVIVTFTQID